MKKLAGLLILLSIATGVSAASSDVETKIRRVENGLLPSILIKGGPAWTIDERMKSYGVPGLCVAVINNFEIEWAKGYGVIETGTDKPVTGETLFQAASISKCMASVIALNLAEHGILDLDGDVNDMLVSWKVPENDFTKDEKVTIRRILNHTAGLTVGGFRGYDVAGGEKVPTILEVLDGKEPANSAPIRVDMIPGTATRYSGGGYTVLQLLMEDVTGRSLHDLASEKIFTPLGMTNSSFEKPLPEDLYRRISAGHLRDGSSIEGYWFLPSGSTCCGLWTTPVDLAKFAIELQKSIKGESNRILSTDMTSEMLTPVPATGYALGMFITINGEDGYFTHSGGNIGFRCVMTAHLENGCGAAIMTNSDRGGELYQEILRSIASEYGWGGFLPETHESVQDAVRFYRSLKKENPWDERVSEGTLNAAGYEMMAAGERETAIALLRLNLELYPKSANCFDSLAEAYMNAGDGEKAVMYYKQALKALDSFPGENLQAQGLRESVPKRLEELQKR